MKVEYHFEVALARLAVKSNLTSSNFKLSLVSGLQDPNSIIKYEASYFLTLRRMNKVIELTSFDPFKFVVEEQKKEVASYGLLLENQSGSSEIIDSFVVNSTSIIEEFQEFGKTIFDQRFQGDNINLTYKVVLEKKEVQLLNPIIKLQSSKEEGQDLRQSGRSRRPPELVIKKKNQLLDSQKLKKDKQIQKSTQKQIPSLFQGLAESPKTKPREEDGFVVNVIQQKQKQKQKWEPFSAIPETLSAWFRKKKKTVAEPEMSEEVKQLLESHHPMIVSQVHQKSQLSMKLKIVVALLIFGVLLLIVDNLKKTVIRQIFGQPKKIKKHRHKDSRKESGINKDKTKKKSKKKERKIGDR